MYATCTCILNSSQNNELILETEGTFYLLSVCLKANCCEDQISGSYKNFLFSVHALISEQYANLIEHESNIN